MRRTRHRRRFHTDRIVAARRARYLRETPAWWCLTPEWRERLLSYGWLADRDPWDCGRHCLWCHPDKFCEPRRVREKRAWRRYWGLD